MDIMAEAMGAALADDLDISDSDDEDGGGGSDQGSEITFNVFSVFPLILRGFMQPFPQY